jgi:CopG family nickel-responsive transcriptional regulator
MTVISVSLTHELLNRLDDFVEKTGYSSRSEAIRIAVREILSQFTLQRMERGQVVATVTVISDRERHDLNSRLMELRHEFDESIFGNMHLHIGRGYCVEIFILREEALPSRGGVEGARLRLQSQGYQRYKGGQIRYDPHRRMKRTR